MTDPNPGCPACGQTDHFLNTVLADVTADPLLAPWSLAFGRNGTEGEAVIVDAAGDPLVVSRPFWLPDGDDPVPPTLAAVRLMAAAPALLAALDDLLAQTVDQDLRYGIALSEGETDARERALAAIALANP